MGKGVNSIKIVYDSTCIWLLNEHKLLEFSIKDQTYFRCEYSNGLSVPTTEAVNIFLS